METFVLEHNPFLAETKIFRNKKEGKEVVNFGWLKSGEKLSCWIKKLFEELYEKCGDPDMVIEFKGIQRDYEFLEDAKDAFVETLALDGKKCVIELKWKQTVDTKDKMRDLKKLFEKIQRESPFDTLKADSEEGKKLKSIFETTVSEEFEMAVVATMSSGKSTLINAMLGKKLLPARTGSTTATLAEIRNIVGAEHFLGKSYDKDGEENGSYDPLTKEQMNKLNGDPNTSLIRIEGNIAGIKSDDLHLVLIDTPGPNYSGTDEHKNRTYELLKRDYKPMVLYILDASDPEINDDENLLNDISEEMNKADRQGHDRFIFVINKADVLDSEERIDDCIEKAKNYLKKHKIKDARIFPTSSKFAKIIRQQKNGDKLTEDEKDELEKTVQDFIDKNAMHFSEHAPLSRQTKEEQKKMIERAKRAEDKYAEALVYTGIPALELAISEYLSKYAMPQKLTEGVNSFKEKIDNLKIEAEENKKLDHNKGEVAKRKRILKEIKQRLDDGEKGKKITEKIKQSDIREELDEKLMQVTVKFVDKWRDFYNKMPHDEVSLKEAQEHIEKLEKGLQEMEGKYLIDIKNVMESALVSKLNSYVEEYRSYVKDLVNTDEHETRNPATILGDTASITLNGTLHSYKQIRSEKNKDYHIIIDDIGNFFKFLFNKEQKQKYITKEVVNWKDYVKKNVREPLESFYRETGDAAHKGADEEIKKIKSYFKTEIDKLEIEIKKKVDEQTKNLEDKDKFERMIQENNNNLKWLNGIVEELDSLLSIGNDTEQK